jgi:ribosomal protein S18 acetylase RimI-like enzyme
VEEMAGHNKLFLEETSEGLYFFIKEEACSRLYYYLRQDAKPLVKRQELPVILEYVLRGEESAALDKAGCSKWLEQGFYPYKRYRRMECLRENFIPPIDQQSKLKEYPITEMTRADYPVVAPLWRTGLEASSTFLPDEEEFTRACEAGQVLGIRLPDGEPAAVQLVVTKGRTGFMQHLIVNPKLRGQGLGRTLCSGSTSYLMEKRNCAKVNFWVDEENTHAIGIYERVGFVYDGTISRQFKLDAIESYN